MFILREYRLCYYVCTCCIYSIFAHLVHVGLGNSIKSILYFPKKLIRQKMNNKTLLAIFLSHALHLFNFSFIKKEVNKRRKKSLKNIEPFFL